ncbi:outer membrane lipid asymmetry maintenance protein MlaD [Yoonia sp. 208BN28-4]|uniref:outer membrane lipid asymmetry maintenance protein MlaD n=1 Tax=Yoonia sp. 208BN28-4 TaxID=3126505 RepID=UPI00309C3ACC
MRENTTEVIVGGVVLAAAIGFGVFAAQAAGLGSGGGTYPLTASFRSVEGVTAGTDVKLAGVKIGTVTAITLNPQSFRGDTTLAVQDGVMIPNDSAVVIASEGLLGGNFIEIVPGGSLDNFAPDDEIEDTQGAISLISLLLKFVTGEGDGQ